MNRPGEKTVTIMDMRGLTFLKASNLYYLRIARWYTHVRASPLSLDTCRERAIVLSLCAPTNAPLTARPTQTHQPTDQPRKQALLATAGVCENRIGPILVVHAPLSERMGGVMKRLLMAVLPHAYASKLEFVDVHRLQEWIHPDELHADYGGNNTCVALRCVLITVFLLYMAATTTLRLTDPLNVHPYTTHSTPLGESHDERAVRHLLEANRKKGGSDKEESN